ncbi:mediator of RNA polymerase II transcription subunit 1-domain-containing protein [Cladorrhinum samala]|uniref:Mediator of RNA polymerase II transcription subunit 1 n=1 Tax=Cladorrhinum samala TaxID=585594 RepID=A0AAV9HUN8_9PEZI|nr:mediator of RNA polymerase II transcription subunit 1-domain-containing protein [Cladorrhinum samala]
MATPTPMKHALSQQGKTPSQSQHGAAATPPVSTPFSVAHAAFSPYGPRSSPQQVKKSPATATTVAGHPSASAVNFDSPSASAALSALQMGVGMDLGLQGLNLGRSTEDDRAKRLDAIIGILGQSKGLVSEAGLERLAKRLGLDYFFETGMSGSSKKTLIIAGAALELLIEFNKDIVQTLTLGFPDSVEIVNKHAAAAGKILLDDLQLGENQSPLTKSLDRFATNFERLAMLDKLSINPGLNLYEAVAGIYESLHRLYQWEMKRIAMTPAVAREDHSYLDALVLCTRSGRPAMNAKGRVGLSLDYWREKRLQPVRNPEDLKTWSFLIACAPLREIGVSPVRVSSSWIGEEVVKAPLPDELQGQLVVDWLEPEPTFLPSSDQTKPDPMQPTASLMPGPRLPEAVFQAIFDPPLHISHDLWERIRSLGCGLNDPSATMAAVFYDQLVIPPRANKESQPMGGMRTVICTKHVSVAERHDPTTLTSKTHVNTLYIYEAVWGKTLTELTFSTPRHLVDMEPYLRQYAFLSILLENSFKDDASSSPSPRIPKTTPEKTKYIRTLTNQDEYDDFMASPQPEPAELPSSEDLKIDVTLTVLPVPRLQVAFPFGEDRTANILLEIRENGYVHVEAQNVLDERNSVAPNGRERRAEDIGDLLSRFEDLGRWAEFLRSRWGVGIGGGSESKGAVEGGEMEM